MTASSKKKKENKKKDFQVSMYRISMNYRADKNRNQN